jgi:tRNA-Thr(GGU) m(6)t(6)A37 methyltransferase TsaA
MEFCYKAIGIIHSGFTEKSATPIQGVFSEGKGSVELFPEYAGGLKDIEGFSHLYLIYHFDRAEKHCLVQKPFLDGKNEKGIFATRHYNRPNHIGLSIVELLAAKYNVLEIGGVDILDGTPLLDIKPYVRHFDIREDVRSGWFDERHIDEMNVRHFTPEALKDHDERCK